MSMLTAAATASHGHSPPHGSLPIQCREQKTAVSGGLQDDGFSHIMISPSLENLLKISSEMTVKSIRIVESAQALPSAPFDTIV